MKLITHSKTLVYSLVIALLLSCTTPIFATSSPETPRMDYLAPTEPTSILNLTQEEVTNLFNDFIANRTPTLSTEHSLLQMC